MPSQDHAWLAGHAVQMLCKRRQVRLAICVEIAMVPMAQQVCPGGALTHPNGSNIGNTLQATVVANVVLEPRHELQLSQSSHR
jgi:hypothetical protein